MPSILLADRFARELPEMAVAWNAEPAPDPRLLILNDALAADLGLDPGWLRTPDGIGLLTGTTLPPKTNPVAQAYSGHQFGNLTPRLGDGRALLLGEIGDRDLHLKGSGRTPFARGGDGLAVVGPMLREYVISEAMHTLGIPTTRSLAVVATGRTVQRETPQPGAVLARVAASHLRVGSFQYAALTGDLALVRKLADYAIARHHPGAAAAPDPYLALFESVMAAQAQLVSRWMLVGFVHGVMNTDNTTISGETIDYGPCAFMESYSPETVFSSIDQWGRYAYGNQPAIIGWNLARFAETLLPLLHDDTDRAIEIAQDSLATFRERYETAFATGLQAKLGVSEALPDEMASELLEQLTQSRVDFTSFFRHLSSAARGDSEPVRGLFVDLAAFDGWLARWLLLDPDADLMDRTNPIYIPRNHLVEEALAAATTGDMGPTQQLMVALGAPYTERPGLQRYAEPAPDDFVNYRTFCGT
nr:YdiU family protein [Mycobacterium sp. MS1601]